MNIQKAIRFIEENGTELEKYRLRYLLGKEEDKELPLKHLKALQNDDGGFRYDDEKGKLSSVNSASVNLALMVELGLEKSEVCRKTVAYLLKVQGEDGSWDEDEAINQYNPPFWDAPGDLRTKMWLTANVSNYLIQLGHEESVAIRKAVALLLGNRDKDGKFAGFLHSTWLSIGVFGQLEGSHSDVVDKALRVLDQSIGWMEDGAGDFAWCLECLHVAGVPKDNPVTKKCIARLVELQSEDGAWSSGDGGKYTVSATISALRVLKNYGIW